jgi:hypothetical protein
MDIYFDFELDDNVEAPKDHNNLVHKGIKDFVKARYAPIWDEVRESTQSNELPPYVVLYMSNEGLGIKRFNIPPELDAKLKECFSEEDLDYITNVLWHKIKDIPKWN